MYATFLPKRKKKKKKKRKKRKDINFAPYQLQLIV